MHAIPDFNMLSDSYTLLSYHEYLYLILPLDGTAGDWQFNFFAFSGFDSVPPSLQRRQPDEEVRMEWILPSEAIEYDDTRFYYSYGGDVDSHFLQLVHEADGEFTSNINGDSYRGRVVGHYTTQNRSVSFTLKELGLADAGTYGCQHRYALDVIEDFTPVIFIYGESDFPH